MKTKKISKKVLGMVLCGFIAFGGTNLKLIKADAATPSKYGYNVSKPGEWEQIISFKLRAKWNYFYKSWWKMKLHYKDGILRMEGNSNIPDNLTFDDDFRIRYMTYCPSIMYSLTGFGPSMSLKARYTMERAKEIFNNMEFKCGDTIFIYGENWNDTFTYSNLVSSIHQWSKNDYSQGFKSIPKRERRYAGFQICNDGLYEARYML